MVRIGVVGVPGGWSSELMVDAFRKKARAVSLIDMRRVRFDSARRTILFEGSDLMKFDAIVIRKLGPRYHPDLLDRIEMLSLVEERGLRVYSRPKRLVRVIDRLSNTMLLRLAALPTPPTVITEDIEQAAQAIRSFGIAVLKPLYTSKAQGMVVIGSDDPALEERITRFRAEGNTTIYVQQMAKTSGKDISLVFFGQRFIAAYARVKEEDAENRLLTPGGRYENYEPSAHMLDIAKRAQYIFNLHYTVVDMVETPSGPLILQVSALGGFRGMMEGCGIDPATRYADYILSRLK